MEGGIAELIAMITHKRTEEVLQNLPTELERRLRARTVALARINTTLRQKIAEHKKAEEALRESEARYRNLFENANDPIATFTLDGLITSVNRAAERLLGWSRAELIGQSYHTVVTPASMALVDERTRRFLAGEKLPSSLFEIELVSKDG